MTVMAANTKEFSVNELLELAARTAGIMAMEQPATGPQWEARAAYGRKHLDLVLRRLQADGKAMRDVELTTVAIVAGTAEYTLAVDTVDVYGEAMLLPSGSSTENVVQQVDRETWHTYPDKVSQSEPNLFFVDRGASVVLRLLPVPATAGSLRIQRQRLLANVTDGNATVDVERYYQDYLMYELAARFREGAGMSAGSVAALDDKARMKLGEAQTKAKQATPNQMVLNHPGGY